MVMVVRIAMEIDRRMIYGGAVFGVRVPRGLRVEDEGDVGRKKIQTSSFFFLFFRSEGEIRY